MANRLFEQGRLASRRSNLPSPAKTEEWQRALRVVAKIGESPGSPEGRFRSSCLMPGHAVDELRTDPDWSLALSEVVSKRRVRNDQNRVAEESVSPNFGRLLIYFPHESLADGASQFSSYGLLRLRQCSALGPLGLIFGWRAHELGSSRSD
jgi:hypothetical protein